MTIKKIAVVISAYNESGNIEKLYKDIVKAFKIYKIPYQLIFVIDGNDGSCESLRKLSKNNKSVVINCSKKPRGFGNSFKIGFRLISKDVTHVFTMDADLNHKPQEMINFINYMNAHPDCDVVIGSRYIKGSKMFKREFFKSFVSTSANLIFPILLGLKIKDISSGYRLYKKDVLLSCLNKLKRENFEFLAEILFRLRKYNLKEIPITFEKRIDGVSKFRWFKTFRGYLKLCILR